MVSIEDFTRLPRGSKVPSVGRVGRCPRCGRNGIPQKKGITQGGPSIVYLHLQISEVLGDGMRTDPRDCCAVSDS